MLNFFSGPWHLLKLILARIWLAWKFVRHPRELNVINTMSKKYENVGIVDTNVEKDWEQPKSLLNREVSSKKNCILIWLIFCILSSIVS